MGGLATEVSETSTDLVIEAAHFSAPGVARMSRRHRLFSQASARFERGVDYELPLRASAKAVAHARRAWRRDRRARATRSRPRRSTPVTIVMPADHPDRVAGTSYGTDTVISRLREVGCTVERSDARRQRRAELADRHAAVLAARPDRPERPGRRGDQARGLREGRDRDAACHRRARAGRPPSGCAAPSRRALAGAGYVEVISSPFGSAADFDRLQLAR